MVRFMNLIEHDVESDVERVRATYAKCTWPDAYYGIVPYLLHGTKPDSIAEIGVAFGFHAKSILDALPTIKYFGIDPYKAGYDDADIFSSGIGEMFGEPDPQKGMDRLAIAVAKSLEPFGERARLIREEGKKAASLFSDAYFDLIFVDGDHTYDGVRADIEAWWPKLKPGAVMCGDDYSKARFGVKKAVDDFAWNKKLNLTFAHKIPEYPIWVLYKNY